MGDPDARVEITLRLWRASSQRDFETYIDRLLELLARHGGRFERRASEVGVRVGQADAVLVLSFPGGSAVDAFLHDPRRHDMEQLAKRAVIRCVISNARTRPAQQDRPPDDPAGVLLHSD